MPLRFRGIADLHQVIQSSTYKLPKLDLLVAIPRSGLLPATILSDLLDLPLTDIDGLREGYLLRDAPSVPEPRDPGRVVEEATQILVIDDSIGHGTQLATTRQALVGLDPAKALHYAAVYVTPESMDSVDIAFEELPWGRYFGWNAMHRASLEDCCLDADGLLWLQGVSFVADTPESAIWKPTKPVGHILTNRSAEERPAMERWLSEQQIQFGTLTMTGTAGRDASRESDDEIRAKSRAYRNLDSKMLISLSYPVSKRLAHASGKPVLCVSAQRIIQPSLRQRLGTSVRRRVRWQVFKSRHYLGS